MSRNEVVRKGNKGRTIVIFAGGAHNGGEEGAGEQRAPFHHQFEVSTSLLLHIIIITISSN